MEEGELDFQDEDDKEFFKQMDSMMNGNYMSALNQIDKANEILA